MKTENTCVILGAGGYAREALWQIKAATDSFKNYVFVDDVSNINEITIGSERFPVVSDWNFTSWTKNSDQIGFIVAVGNPQIKIKLVEKALAAGLKPLPTIVHPHATIDDPNCQLGFGGLISARCVLTTNIVLGDYVLLNSAVTIGHDTTIGNFTTCAPQVAIAGNVKISEAVTLGIGSVVKEKIFIAANVIAGAQACIVSDINEKNITVIGIPAKKLSENGR